ncbi:MAG: hypothetical protein R2754_17380 [Microthrixaceae bacterium]
MDTDAASLFWFLVPWVVVPGVFVVLALRSPSWRQMTRWAAAAQVTITENNEGLIADRLGRARRYRSLASFPLWWIPGVPLIIGPEPAWLTRSAWIPLTAYIVGSMVAGLRGAGDHRGVRSATLDPRSASDYVPANFRWAPLALLGPSAILLAAIELFGAGVPIQLRWHVPQLMVAAAVALAAEGAVRALASQPQPAAAPSVLDADDALRATGATAAVASAVMLALLNLGGLVSAAAPRGWVAWATMPIGVVTTGGACLMLWMVVTQQPWVPSRRRAGRPQPAPLGR